MRVRIDAPFVLLDGQKPRIREEELHLFGRERVHGGLHEVRTVVIRAHDVGIAQVAASVARREDGLADAVGRLEDGDLSALPAGADRGHDARCTSADDGDLIHERHSLHENEGLTALVTDYADINGG